MLAQRSQSLLLQVMTHITVFLLSVGNEGLLNHMQRWEAITLCPLYHLLETDCTNIILRNQGSRKAENNSEMTSELGTQGKNPRFLFLTIPHVATFVKISSVLVV